jgi:hypothetical protein
MLQEQGVVGDACLPVAGLSRTSDSRAPRAAGLDGVTASEPEKQAGPILITYNGSPAALRALVLVTWLLAERRTCRWSRGRADSDANCLRSRLSRDSRRPRSTPHGPGDHEGRAETARWIDRTVGAIARGAGLETEVSLSPSCRRSPSQRRSSGSRASETATRCSSPPAPRSSQPRPNGDPAGVGRMPESLIIPFVLIGISVGKGAHCSVERVPGAEIGADRDRVA